MPFCLRVQLAYAHIGVQDWLGMCFLFHVVHRLHSTYWKQNLVVAHQSITVSLARGARAGRLEARREDGVGGEQRLQRAFAMQHEEPSPAA